MNTIVKQWNMPVKEGNIMITKEYDTVLGYYYRGYITRLGDTSPIPLTSYCNERPKFSELIGRIRK